MLPYTIVNELMSNEETFEPIDDGTRHQFHKIHTNNCRPMVLKSRKEELATFNIENNDIFFVFYPRKENRKVDPFVDIRRQVGIWFEAGEKLDNEKDQLFNIVFEGHTETLVWKAGNYDINEMEEVSPEEMGKVCKRALSYAVEHKHDCYDIPSLYLEFFDYFDGYQSILIRDILNFVDIMTKTTDYELNKNLNNFLQFLTSCIDTAFEYGSKGLFFYDQRGVDRRFITQLAQEHIKYVSTLLKKNKFTHFEIWNRYGVYTEIITHGSKEIKQMYKDVERDLQHRTLIFNETQKLLDDYMEAGYSPTFKLLYYLPKIMTHPVIVFEAIEKFANGKIDGASGHHRTLVEAIERLQFMFPELALLLKEDQLQTFLNKDVVPITIESTNRIYQMLLTRENQNSLTSKDLFAKIGGRINEIGWCNLAACDIFNIPYSNEVESANYPYDDRLFDGEDNWEIVENYPERGNIAQYEKFMNKCENDGEFFYKNMLEWCEETSLSCEFLHDKSEYNLVTPAEDEMFYLHKFLRSYESVRTLFNKYQKEVLDAFLKYMDDTMRFGTALIYYWSLKNYWNSANLAKIEKKLKDRFIAEEYFTSFFQTQSFPVDKIFNNNVVRCPLAYCYSFVAVYMSKAIQKEPQDQSKLLKLFCMTLHNAKNEKLRNLIYQKSIERRRFRNRIYYIIKSAKTYEPLEVKTIFERTWPDVINLYIWKAEISEYEKLAFETVTVLDRGAFAIAEVVKVPDFATETVAKIFIEKQINVADEIECLMKIQFNPHVVQIYGFVVDKGSYVGILMEYCKGGSLRKVILDEKIKYDAKRILWWAMQAASGLTFLHRRNIIHRDVKPANLLLDENHHVLKVSDLGLSKVSPNPEIPLSQVDLLLSGLAGTKGFFPPNLSVKYSAALDVFSLGRSIWSMIFRRDPTDEEDVSKTLKNGTPSDISEELWEYVIRMMSLDERTRPTMEECYQFFKRLHGDFQPI